MLPGSLREACGVPGAAGGAQVGFLSEFGVHLGAHLGLRDHANMYRIFEPEGLSQRFVSAMSISEMWVLRGGR